MISEELNKKWMKEYIEGLDLQEENRKYLNLRIKTAKTFVNENYYDKEVKKYVTGYSDVSLLGLQYIDYVIYNDELTPQEEDSLRYFLCVVPNNKGLYTIVSLIKYYDEFYFFKDQTKPVTFIEYAETNSFLRHKGLYKDTVDALPEFINFEQNILTTPESVIGFRHNTFNILKNSFLSYGYDGDIRTEAQIDNEYKLMLK